MRFLSGTNSRIIKAEAAYARYNLEPIEHIFQARINQFNRIEGE
jgi:hypothetical protein